MSRIAHLEGIERKTHQLFTECSDPIPRYWPGRVEHDLQWSIKEMEMLTSRTALDSTSGDEIVVEADKVGCDDSERDENFIVIDFYMPAITKASSYSFE